MPRVVAPFQQQTTPNLKLVLHNGRVDCFYLGDLIFCLMLICKQWVRPWQGSQPEQENATIGYEGYTKR